MERLSFSCDYGGSSRETPWRSRKRSKPWVVNRTIVRGRSVRRRTAISKRLAEEGNNPKYPNIRGQSFKLIETPYEDLSDEPPARP